MLGSVQIEIIKALAAIDVAKPGRSTSIPELVNLIFNAGEVSEKRRVTVTRALSKLDKDEKMVVRIDGRTTRDVRWQLHPNIVRTLIRPEGIDYAKRVKRLIEEAAR
jgi:hypothetical protein